MQDETLARFKTLVERINGEVYVVTPEQQEWQYELARRSWEYDETEAAGVIDNGRGY